MIGRRLVAAVVMSVLLIFALGPIAWMMLTSIKGPTDVVSVPPRFLFAPTFDNYAQVLGLGVTTNTFNFLNDLRNSVILTFGSVSISTLLGVPLGFAISRYRFRGKQAVGFAALTLYFAPALVLVLPLYTIFQSVRLYGTHWGLIVAFQVISLPLMIWMSRTAFDEVPVEIEEAARVDGAAEWRVVTTISVPLARGGITTGALLASIFVWNNFFFGLIFATPETRPVTVAALTYVGYSSIQWGSMAAAVILSILPVLTVATIFQKSLVKGLTVGAVK